MPGGGPNTRSGADRHRGVGEPSSGLPGIRRRWPGAERLAHGSGRGVALPSGGARRGGREPGKSDPIDARPWHLIERVTGDQAEQVECSIVVNDVTVAEKTDTGIATCEWAAS